MAKGDQSKKLLQGGGSGLLLPLLLGIDHWFLATYHQSLSESQLYTTLNNLFTFSALQLYLLKMTIIVLILQSVITIKLIKITHVTQTHVYVNENVIMAPDMLSWNNAQQSISWCPCIFFYQTTA